MFCPRCSSCLVAIIAASLTLGCGDDGDDGSTSVGATTAAATGSTSAATGGAQSTGAEEQGPYPRCEGASSCFLSGFESCILPGAGTADGFCTSSCTDASVCETPATGTATPTCEDLSGDGPICYLECSTGTCPDGMVCNDQLFATRSVCFWRPD